MTAVDSVDDMLTAARRNSSQECKTISPRGRDLHTTTRNTEEYDSQNVREYTTGAPPPQPPTQNFISASKMLSPKIVGQRPSQYRESGPPADDDGKSNERPIRSRSGHSKVSSRAPSPIVLISKR